MVFFNKFWNGHAIKDGCRGEILSNMMENEQQTILDDKRNMMVDLYNQLHELGVNGGVKTSHVAAQKSTTSGHLERAMETG